MSQDVAWLALKSRAEAVKRVPLPPSITQGARQPPLVRAHAGGEFTLA